MGCLIVYSETIYNRRELTFATENRSESSTDGNRGKNDSDSDLTDTSELAQPLAERNCCEVFFGMYSSIKRKFSLSLSVARYDRHPPRRIPAWAFQLVNGQYFPNKREGARWVKTVQFTELCLLCILKF
jgi:hypothetical protein